MFASFCDPKVIGFLVITGKVFSFMISPYDDSQITNETIFMIFHCFSIVNMSNIVSF